MYLDGDAVVALCTQCLEHLGGHACHVNGDAVGLVLNGYQDGVLIVALIPVVVGLVGADGEVVLIHDIGLLDGNGDAHVDGVADVDGGLYLVPVVVVLMVDVNLYLAVESLGIDYILDVLNGGLIDDGHLGGDEADDVVDIAVAMLLVLEADEGLLTVGEGGAVDAAVVKLVAIGTVLEVELLPGVELTGVLPVLMDVSGVVLCTNIEAEDISLRDAEGVALSVL